MVQSPADKGLGYVYVLGCELPVSRTEDVFPVAICAAPRLLTSLPKTPGCCDLMTYNHVIFEVLLPLFLSCLFILRIFKHSSKDQKSPKAVGSHTLLLIWGGVKTGSAGISI